MSSIRGSAALVIGDVMLDCYLEGRVQRISPEAPVPVVSLAREWFRPGGAGHVAASLAGLGCRVTLAGVIGSDDRGRQVRQALVEAGVGEALLVERNGPQTICKTRVIASGHQQLIRLDQDGCRVELTAGSDTLASRVLPLVGGHDVVVLSDYDKGTITDELARAVVAECRRRSVPCVVDPKKPSFSAYAGANLLTPNLLETQRVLGRPLKGETEIAEAAVELRAALELEHMLITRGAEGMTLASADGVCHVAAELREVADVTGAGDTVAAVMAASMACGRDIRDACRLASMAAGIAVSHLGCYVVRTAELEETVQGRSPKVLDWNAAQRRVADSRRAGRRVVFTNGCFDILHAGHLTCLERARRLGDLLVVGLNSDASIRINKGPARPVLSERHRALLLAGLSCVDLVVIFEEPTPEALITLLEPDVLVKGGDYNEGTIVGADLVRNRGGQVVVLPLVDGLSTTAILTAGRARHDGT